MRRRVLIVEDDALQAENLAVMLRLRGHDVAGIARSADAAVHLARSTYPEVALVDIRIAGSVDGVDAAAVLNAGYGCEIIFITASTDKPTTDRMRRASPIAILTKPTSTEKIFAAVEGVGSSRRSG